MASVRVCLYISAPSAHSQEALRLLDDFRRALARVDGTIDVIDVFEQPERALSDKVLATPTLVKRAPEPQRRLVGELGDVATALRRLGVEGF